MPKSESDAFMGEYFEFTDGIRKSGHYIGGEALQPVQTATTVRLLCRRLGRTREARAAYERALSLVRQEPERRFLRHRLAGCGTA